MRSSEYFTMCESASASMKSFGLPVPEGSKQMSAPLLRNSVAIALIAADTRSKKNRSGAL